MRRIAFRHVLPILMSMLSIALWSIERAQLRLQEVDSETGKAIARAQGRNPEEGWDLASMTGAGPTTLAGKYMGALNFPAGVVAMVPCALLGLTLIPFFGDSDWIGYVVAFPYALCIVGFWYYFGRALDRLLGPPRPTAVPPDRFEWVGAHALAIVLLFLAVYALTWPRTLYHHDVGFSQLVTVWGFFGALLLAIKIRQWRLLRVTSGREQSLRA